jgi:integrase
LNTPDVRTKKGLRDRVMFGEAIASSRRGRRAMPDASSGVLDSVSSPITRRVYNLGLNEFIAWFAEQSRPAGFTKATVTARRVALEARDAVRVRIATFRTDESDRETRSAARQPLVHLDLVGKHGRVRTIPMPTWAKNAIDAWTLVGGVTEGHLFRPVNRGDQVYGDRMSEKVVWQMLKTYVAGAGSPDIAPHDLRRTTAKLCRAAGGELEQIQLLLGHSLVQTKERYLGTKQDLAHAPNDAIKLKLAV